MDVTSLGSLLKKSPPVTGHEALGLQSRSRTPCDVEAYSVPTSTDSSPGVVKDSTGDTPLPGNPLSYLNERG